MEKAALLTILLLIAPLILLYNVLRKIFQNFQSKQLPDGKVVVISGADTGFGHMTAIRLVQLGYCVFASCLDSTQAASDSQFSELLRTKPHLFHVIQMDVTKDDQIEAAAASVKKWLNANQSYRLHSIVNNAGIVYPMVPIELYSFASFSKVFDVNVFGTFRVVQAFLPLMRAGGPGGRVVVMASLAGELTCPMLSAYCSSKWALIALSDTLRYELQRFGIHVSVILPDLKRTELATNTGRSRAILGREISLMDAKTLEAYGGSSRVEQLHSLIQLMETYADPNLTVVINDIIKAVCSDKPDRRYYPITWRSAFITAFARWFPSIVDKMVGVADL